ncbi:MAG: hypothetical protein IPL31_17835 [Saprospiraceae bacterium]|nr:hypothetical protein [Saprospiraceae bacterium]
MNQKVIKKEPISNMAKIRRDKIKPTVYYPEKIGFNFDIVIINDIIVDYPEPNGSYLASNIYKGDKNYL